MKWTLVCLVLCLPLVFGQYYPQPRYQQYQSQPEYFHPKPVKTTTTTTTTTHRPPPPPPTNEVHIKKKKINNKSVADTQVLPVTLDVKLNLFLKLLLKALENLMAKGILPNGLLGPAVTSGGTTPEKPSGSTDKSSGSKPKGLLGLPLHLNDNVLHELIESLENKN